MITTSSPRTRLHELEQRFAALKDLEHLGGIVGWDQEVLMPQAAGEARAQALATLARVVHERACDPALIECIQTLRSAAAELEPSEQRLVQLAWRKVKDATLIPADLAGELALAKSRGLEAWRRARAEDDFSVFRPALKQLVSLSRQIAHATAAGRSAYDTLIDHYEPGATMAQLVPLLDALEQATLPLLDRVRGKGSKHRKHDTKVALRRYPVDEQQRFAREVVGKLGFEFSRGRVDLSTHPFCGGNGPTDVRLTTRFEERDLRVGLYGMIHEAGHGMYEQGLDPDLSRSPLGGAVSMAIHESQSRLWENGVGRSRAFWKYWWKPLKKSFKAATEGFKSEDMWRAVNTFKPGFIRVEADELTYNLHIILRTRLEQQLFNGQLEVEHLPEAWNQAMRDLLGLEVKSNAQGCLQDIHWSMGAFGYFPTYSIGNLYAAQFLEAASAELGDLDAAFAAGDFMPLRAWLQKEIHRHDQRYTASELVQRITGRQLDTLAWQRAMESKLDALG